MRSIRRRLGRGWAKLRGIRIWGAGRSLTPQVRLVRTQSGSSESCSAEWEGSSAEPCLFEETEFAPPTKFVPRVGP
jgi:hypothetical protein